MLGTVELLESILLYLQPTNVVRIRRVNSSWQATVAGSPSLRRHIFLEPKPVSEIFTVSTQSISPDYLFRNPQRMIEEGDKIAVSIHPLLTDTAKLDLTWQPMSCEFDIDIVQLSSLPGQEWRDMLVTNPPANVIEILVCDSTEYSVEVTMSSRGGVTLGALYDAFWEHDSRPISAKTSEVATGRALGFISEHSSWVEGLEPKPL